MFEFDNAALTGGLRTTASLLMGNSVLIYYKILGPNFIEAESLALRVFIIGFVLYLLTCLKRKSK